MTTLQSRDYIATDADIKELATARAKAVLTVGDTNRNYLRAIVGTTQDELDSSPRKNFGKAVKLKPEEQVEQLAALDAVHERFYAIVVEVNSEHLPPGKARAKELNDRTNYARTAVRAARNWIKAGFDIRPLPASKITKRALDVAPRTRPPSAPRLKKQVETRSKALVSSLLELGALDRAGAVAELELLMGQLAGQLAELGGKPVTDARKAAEQHVPFRAKGSSVTFVPTQSQVLRQQERPS